MALDLSKTPSVGRRSSDRRIRSLRSVYRGFLLALVPRLSILRQERSFTVTNIRLSVQSKLLIPSDGVPFWRIHSLDPMAAALGRPVPAARTADGSRV